MNIEESSSTPPRRSEHSPRRERAPRSGERGGRGGDRRPGSGGGSGGRGRSGPDRRRGERRDEAPKPGNADQPKNGSAEKVADSTILDGGLIAAVSRSFSLTIQALPEPLRKPITLGYLLARAQDTVADTPGLPAGTRLEHLRALLEMVKYGPDPEILGPLQRDLVSKQKHDGERELLQKLGTCLAALEAMPTADRWELRRALARIGRAQELDLLRFGDATAAEPKTLATAGELEEYTYLIAGCVGELWTRLCQRHLPAGWSKLDETGMLALGKRFGQGLQMVNILRDLPEDLAQGRCYLPADLLADHGLSAGDLLKEPKRTRPLLDALREEALDHLDAAWDYVKALTPRKLRFACALPVLIGLETLALLKKNPALETKERVKVSRSTVRNLMASASFGTLFSPWLRGLHARLRKSAA